MGQVKGRFVRLSLPRRLIGDFLRASQGVPAIPMQRRMCLAEPMAARAASAPRPSWCAIFTKALARVAARRPELRRAYMGWPWPRLFQYDQNLVSVVVERDWRGEPALFLARLPSPESMPLVELDRVIRGHKEQPLQFLGDVRRDLRIARLPNPVRRLLWWVMINWMPRTRARILGNLGVSVTAGMGGAALLLITPWTASLVYDRFDEHGNLDVRLTFDHRVVDAALVARALVDMEGELCGPILQELQALRQAAAA